MRFKDIAEYTWIAIFCIGVIFLAVALGTGLVLGWLWTFDADVDFSFYGRLIGSSAATGVMCLVLCGGIINLFDL